MSEELAVSTKTIQRGIKKLEERNVIVVGKKRTKDGKWLNNTYTLLDKNVWNYTQETNSPMDSQGTKSDTARGQKEPSQRTNSPTKETHTEGNTYKETHILQTEVCGKEINELISLFEEINPTINYGNKTLRKDLEELLKKFGREKLENTIKYAISVQSQKYSPTITTPTQLKNKLGDLMVYYNKENKTGIQSL